MVDLVNGHMFICKAKNHANSTISDLNYERILKLPSVLGRRTRLDPETIIVAVTAAAAVAAAVAATAAAAAAW